MFCSRPGNLSFVILLFTPVELRHLRYFVSVAETENVSRAALKLHISQPALSRQIRDLEEEIGVLLLERTAKSVSLTQAGRVFLPEARAVLQRADQAIKKAQAVAGADTELHIGHSPTPTARLLPVILRAYQRAMPDVRVRLHDLRNDQNLAGLREGRLHLAFVWLPRRKSALGNLRFEELTQESARRAGSPKHQSPRRDTVSLADAAREPFVVYNREEYPASHRRLFAVFVTVKTTLRMVGAVAG